VDLKNVTGQVLTAAAMNAHNTFDNPQAIKPAAFSDFQIKGDGLEAALPAKSVVVLEMQ
jgi:alpha-N-arabinofuranosidase